MFKKNNFSFFVLMALFALRAVPVFAQNTDEFPGVDLTVQDIANIITDIACWLISIVFALMVIYIIYAGILFLLAGGNSEKLSNAKATFKSAIIGTAVILGTNIIIATIADFVSQGTWSYIPFNC